MATVGTGAAALQQHIVSRRPRDTAPCTQGECGPCLRNSAPDLVGVGWRQAGGARKDGTGRLPPGAGALLAAGHCVRGMCEAVADRSIQRPWEPPGTIRSWPSSPAAGGGLARGADKRQGRPAQHCAGAHWPAQRAAGRAAARKGPAWRLPEQLVGAATVLWPQGWPARAQFMQEILCMSVFGLR
jgi:hypothetical protein